MISYITPDSVGFESVGNTANAKTDVWRYTVPRTTNVLLTDDRPIEMYVPTVDTFDGDGSTTTFTVSQDMVDVPRKTEDVIVFVGGTEQTRGSGNDYTVDYANDQITFNTAPASGTDNIEVFYIPVAGNAFDLSVYNNESRDRNDPLASPQDRSLHEIDQLDDNQAVRISGDQPLVPKMVVTLEVDSSFQYTVDSRIVDRLFIVRLPYRNLDASQVDADAVRSAVGN